MREQTWSHPISMELREYSRLPTLLKLLRELIEGLVGKQKSIHQPCGAMVLMAKWSAITLAANNCGYSGKAEELIVTYVHPLF